MRIISKSIDFRAQDELLQGIAPLSDFLLLDIETTGLSAEHNAVYLIGCIYHQTDGWNLIQWIGEGSSLLLSPFRFRIPDPCSLQRRPVRHSLSEKENRAPLPC